MIDPKTAPIGVFDSGVGGVSVLKELRRAMPQENFVFIADSKNAPYGVRPADEVRALSEISLKKLVARGSKEIVIACNTATAVAADELRRAYPDLPIVGIEPAVKPAAVENTGKRILLLATPLTLKMERIALLKNRFDALADIDAVPCSGLVELIEGGHLDDAPLFSYFDKTFGDYLDPPPAAVVLGCTHYPHIKPALARFFGDGVRLYDGGVGTARRARALLAERGLLNPSSTPGAIEMESTSGDPKIIALCEKLLND